MATPSSSEDIATIQNVNLSGCFVIVYEMWKVDNRAFINPVCIIFFGKKKKKFLPAEMPKILECCSKWQYFYVPPYLFSCSLQPIGSAVCPFLRI